MQCRCSADGEELERLERVILEAQGELADCCDEGKDLVHLCGLVVVHVYPFLLDEQTYDVGVACLVGARELEPPPR